MKLRLWSLRVGVSLGLALAAGGVPTAQAWPLLDRPVPIGDEPLLAFPDDELPGVFWYLPLSIGPWPRESAYRPSLYETSEVISFVFRGRFSADRGVLERVATSLGTTLERLIPISVEGSKDDDTQRLLCQGVEVGDQRLKWILPKELGDFSGVIPISFRATGADLVKKVSSRLHSGGLACSVGVRFQGVSTAYRVELTTHLDRIFERFQAENPAKGLWSPGEIRSMLEKLKQEGVITLSSLGEGVLSRTDLNDKVHAAMEKATRVIREQLFVLQPKLPDEPMSASGKAFALDSAYRPDSERAPLRVILQGDRVQTREAQIAIRVALE